MAALDELIRDHGATLCLVSHGGILRLAAAHLLGLPVVEAWTLDVDNASLSRLTRQGARRRRGGSRRGTTRPTCRGTRNSMQDEAEGAPLAL